MNQNGWLISLECACHSSPSTWSSYGAGLTLINPWRFALATLLGLIPASFLLAHFGGEMAGADMNKAMTALLLIGLLVAVPLVFRRVRAHHRRDRETGK